MKKIEYSSLGVCLMSFSWLYSWSDSVTDSWLESVIGVLCLSQDLEVHGVPRWWHSFQSPIKVLSDFSIVSLLFFFSSLTCVKRHFKTLPISCSSKCPPRFSSHRWLLLDWFSLYHEGWELVFHCQHSLHIYQSGLCKPFLQEALVMVLV